MSSDLFKVWAFCLAYFTPCNPCVARISLEIKARLQNKNENNLFKNLLGIFLQKWAKDTTDWVCHDLSKADSGLCCCEM